MTTSETPRTDAVWLGYFPIPATDERHEESKNLERELAAANEQIAKLNERLENNYYFDAQGKRHECEPGTFPDGISCRDETIELLKERIAELERALAKETELHNYTRAAWETDGRMANADIAKMRDSYEKRLATVPPGYVCVPVVLRPTGRTIPDLTNIEHVCKWQRNIVLTAERKP